MKNKTSKDNEFHNKKILRSLKIINNSDSLRHKSLINKKNNINIIKHNESNIITKKSTDRAGVERRKTGFFFFFFPSGAGMAYIYGVLRKRDCLCRRSDVGNKAAGEDHINP